MRKWMSIDGKLRKYRAYLDSALWRDLPAKHEAIQRDGGRCRLCNSAENLEIHHRHYPEMLGSETADDLTTLCHACHEDSTNMLRLRRGRRTIQAKHYTSTSTSGVQVSVALVGRNGTGYTYTSTADSHMQRGEHKKKRNKTVSERNKRETVQIEPYIRRDLKERLDAEKADRNVPLGTIVDAALEQYFGLRDEAQDQLEVVLALTASIDRKLSIVMGHLDILPRLVGEAPTPEPAEVPDSLEQWYGLESSRRPEVPQMEDTAPARRKRSWWR